MQAENSDIQRGREVYYAIVAAAAQRYREGEGVYWHDIVAAAAQRYREGEEGLLL